MTREYGVISAIAQCQICGKEFDSYKNCQALAAQHARIYGHYVTGEVANGFEYDARGNK